MVSDALRVPAPFPARALTVEDLCYNAFMTARAENDEDGGPTDWMTDTKPKLQPMIDQFNARLSVLDELWRLSLVIESAVRTADPGAHAAVLALVKRANTALGKDPLQASQGEDR